MSSLSEVMTTHYTKKWAEYWGLDKKNAKEALKLITDIAQETDFDYNLIESVVLSTYPFNPPETIFEKFERNKNNKNAGRLVKFARY